MFQRNPKLTSNKNIEENKTIESNNEISINYGMIEKIWNQTNVALDIVSESEDLNKKKLLMNVDREKIGFFGKKN